MKIDNDKLVMYLSNELNEKDKKDFEKEIYSNHELKSVLDDLNQNDKILQSLNNHSVSSDFMLKLNEKIDLFEESRIPWYSRLINTINLSDFNTNKLAGIPQVAVCTLILIVSFTFYKINYSYSNAVAVDTNIQEDLIADAPNDDIINDSLKLDIDYNQFIYNNNKISK